MTFGNLSDVSSLVIEKLSQRSREAPSTSSPNGNSDSKGHLEPEIGLVPLVLGVICGTFHIPSHTISKTEEEQSPWDAQTSSPLNYTILQTARLIRNPWSITLCERG